MQTLVGYANFASMHAEQERLSTGRMLRGLTAAAVAGLMVYVILTICVPLIQAAVAALAFGREWEGTQILGLAALYLVFGLPIALILGLAVGLPIWRLADSRGLRSARNALWLGAVVGGLIGCALALLNFVTGLQTYLDDSSRFDSWTYGYQVTRDGLPTLLGWVFEVLNVLYCTLAGGVGGFVARFVALPRTVDRDVRLPPLQ